MATLKSYIDAALSDRATHARTSADLDAANRARDAARDADLSAAQALTASNATLTGVLPEGRAYPLGDVTLVKIDGVPTFLPNIDASTEEVAAPADPNAAPAA